MTSWDGVSRGVFNIEGGSYAKTIRLSVEDEPLIHEAANLFESIFENVVVNDGVAAARVRR